MSYYDDLRHSSNDAKRVGWRDSLEQAFRFELVFRLLTQERSTGSGPARDPSVLDVGCGVGDFLGFLEMRGYSGAYHGIDIRPDFVARARDKWGPYFTETDMRDHGGDFDYVAAIGATVADDESAGIADLEACSTRCGARGIYFVLEESSRFDPALEGEVLGDAFMRPLRGEALVLSWERAELNLADAYRAVVRDVPATAGERARLAFNAGLHDAAISEIQSGRSDPLLELVSERIRASEGID